MLAGNRLISAAIRRWRHENEVQLTLC